MLATINKLFDESRQLSSLVKTSTEEIESALLEPKGRMHREKIISDFKKTKDKYDKLATKIVDLADLLEEEKEADEYSRLIDYCTMIEEKITRNEKDIQAVRSFLVFSAWNLKGGSSKTTTNFIISTILAEKYNKRILYLDLDTQGTSSDILDPEFKLKRTGVIELYQLGFPLEDVVRKTKFKNIELVTNSVSCNDVHHFLENSKNTGAINVLSDIITTNLDYLNKSYDYIVIDFAPQTHSLINKSGFICVDSYLYLTYPETSQSTITGITSFEYIYGSQLAKHRLKEQKKALVINRFQEGISTSKAFIEMFSLEGYEELNAIRLNTLIHETVSVGRDVIGNSKLVDSKDNKRLYEEYHQLVTELFERKIL